MGASARSIDGSGRSPVSMRRDTAGNETRHSEARTSMMPCKMRLARLQIPSTDRPPMAAVTRLSPDRATCCDVGGGARPKLKSGLTVASENVGAMKPTCPIVTVVAPANTLKMAATASPCHRAGSDKADGRYTFVDGDLRDVRADERPVEQSPLRYDRRRNLECADWQRARHDRSELTRAAQRNAYNVTTPVVRNARRQDEAQ